MKFLSELPTDVLVWGGLFILAIYFNYFYRFRPGNGSMVSKRFGETTVSRQLVPRIDPLMKSGRRLVVLSWNGSYEGTVSGDNWLSAMKSWLRAGVNIDYLIVSGEADECVQLLALYREFPNHLNVYIWDKTHNHSNEAAVARYKYEFSHPVIVEESNGNAVALWYENYHPHGSHIALDVEYVSPRDIEHEQDRVAQISAEIIELKSSSLLINSENIRLIDCSEQVAA